MNGWANAGRLRLWSGRRRIWPGPMGWCCPLPPATGTCAARFGQSFQAGCQAVQIVRQRPETFAVLTEREWAVAQRMARRLSNREIAGQLFLSEGTVKQYINQIYSKLHLTGDARTKRRRLEELMED